MEVILLENVRKLGKIGDAVKVKDGFARNFLIPNKKAIYATEQNKEVFEKKRAVIEKQNKENLEAAKKLAENFEDKVFNIIRQASEDGRLYGSVTASDIAAAISSKKAEVSRTHITLDNAIKTIGIYKISLNLHSELETKLHINIARSDAEAKDAANKFKKGEYIAPDKAAAAKKSIDEIAAEAEQKLAEQQQQPEETAAAAQ